MFFLLLLLGATPVFIWAVMTQRIELRKRAATSETVICWNRVITAAGTEGNIYQWPNGCGGNPDTSRICTQAVVELTATENYQYQQWRNEGSPYIPGCGMTPPSTTSINWKTPYAFLQASSMAITANGKVFKGIPDPGTAMSVKSDPGNASYTTLEAIWREQGVEMRVFIYFAAKTIQTLNGSKQVWNVSELRTYNGNTPGDWLFYSGESFGVHDVGLPVISSSQIMHPISGGIGELQFTTFKMQAFTNQTTSPLTCGGIRGIICPSGYTCRYPDGSTRPPYPDASGVCRTDNPYPTPTCIPQPACMDPLPGQPACMIKIPEGGWLCPKTPTPTALLTCGGIRGAVCPSGYSCIYSNGTTRPQYPDESGKCILPTKLYSCQSLSTTQSSYFSMCAKQGYSGVCFNKYTGVYQGCTRTGSNDCTVNNTNAAQNILCPAAVTPTPTCIPRPACMDPLPGQPACMIDLPQGGWLCPQTPTPTTQCKTGINSFSVSQPCKDPNTFVSATYSCHDGYSGTVGGDIRMCQTSNVLAELAQKACSGRTSCTTAKIGDLNGDNIVNLFDYNILLNNFGKTGTAGIIKGDLNKDGVINVFDYNILLRNFGR